MFILALAVCSMLTLPVSRFSILESQTSQPIWMTSCFIEREPTSQLACSDIDFKGHHYEFLPFGTGRRGCPGMNMALILLSYTLARLVHSFDWALPDGQKPQDLDMSEKFELALPRAQPLIVVPTPRLPHHLY